MTDLDFWLNHQDENHGYELDESDGPYDLALIDPKMIEALNKLLPHHKLTNAEAQPQRDK